LIALPLLILIPSLILNVVLLRNRPVTPAGVRVIGVIDGDTIMLLGKEKVRLRYVDAPEVELCGSEQATKELTSLELGKTVQIEETIPDQYGRGMALVYDGDTLINKYMVASDWVQYHSDSSSQTEVIKAVGVAAKSERLGIFGLCQSTVNTKHPECNIKGNIDQNKSTNNHKYYIPGCAQYPFTIVEEDIGEQWFCTEKEAQVAGFMKADTCK